MVCPPWRHSSTRGQHEIRALAGKLVGQLLADALRRVGEKDNTLAEMGVHKVLCYRPRRRL